MGLTVEEMPVSHHGAWVERDPEAIIALHSADSVFHRPWGRGADMAGTFDGAPFAGDAWM